MNSRKVTYKVVLMPRLQARMAVAGSTDTMLAWDLRDYMSRMSWLGEAWELTQLLHELHNETMETDSEAVATNIRFNKD